MNKVSQILKSKGNQVVTVNGDVTVLDALKIMSDERVGSVIVMDEGKIAGIFTERDYARRVGLDDAAPSSVPVADVMTKDLVTVSLDSSVNQCMEIITENHIRHLPVLDGDQIVGVVSIGDVVKDMIEELQFMVKQMENYITYFR